MAWQRADAEPSRAENEGREHVATQGGVDHGATAGIGEGVGAGAGGGRLGSGPGGRRKELLDQVVAEAEKPGARAVGVVVTDVGDPASVKALFTVGAKTGHLHFLFNAVSARRRSTWKTRPMNSGSRCRHQPDRPLPSTQEAFMHHARPETLAGGRIVNNGSISAHAPRPNSSPHTDPSRHRSA